LRELVVRAHQGGVLESGFLLLAEFFPELFPINTKGAAGRLRLDAPCWKYPALRHEKRGLRLRFSPIY